MLNKTFNIQLNTKHHQTNHHQTTHPTRTDIILSQGDSNSVIFNFRIYDEGEEIHYSLVSTARLFVAKPDRHVSQLEAERTGAGFSVTLSQNAVAAAGLAVGQLALYGHNDEVLVTLNFSFTVQGKIGADSALDSSDEMGALQSAVALLNKTQELYARFPQGIVEFLWGDHTRQELEERGFPVGGAVIASGHFNIAGYDASPGDVFVRMGEMAWQWRGSIRGPRGEAGGGVDNFRVPVALQLECQNVEISEPVSLFIDTEGAGRQTVQTDATGRFATSFKSEARYDVSVPIPRLGEADIINPSAWSIKTGSLDVLSNYTLSAIRRDLANTEWYEDMQRTAALNADVVYAPEPPGISVPEGDGKWNGGVLAPNGKIYCTPRNADCVLVIDPENNTAETFGELGTAANKWHGGVLAPNGKIFCMPRTASTMLVIDPVTNTAEAFGNLGTTSNKWLGSILAPNGKIFGLPANQSSGLEIDPDTFGITVFGNLGTTTNKWVGGALAPNGKIYCVPSNQSAVLVIDPNTRAVEMIHGMSTSTNKWSGCALAPNGKIYCAPLAASTVLVIDTATHTTQQIGSFGNAADKYVGAVLAPNGKVYIVPSNANSVLVVDPVTNTVEAMPHVEEGTGKWSGGVLAPNGKIYLVPANSDKVLVLSPWRVGGQSGVVNFGSTTLRSAWGCGL